MTSAALPLSTDGVTPSGKATGLVRQGCAFAKAVLNHFPVLQEPQHSSQEDLFCDFPRNRGEADRSGVPRLLLSTFLKNFLHLSHFPITKDFAWLPHKYVIYRNTFYEYTFKYVMQFII